MQDIAKMIDHTVLKPDAKLEDIRKLCREAKEYGFATVCVQPYWVASAKKELEGSDVGITTVIGFPLGMNTTAVKAAETKDAIDNGATEIDMVINLGAFFSGDMETVSKDINAVSRVCKEHGKLLKVILEVGYLNEEQIELASKLSAAAGADFVKTSTGFGPGKATIEAVSIMKKAVGVGVQVKASGGVRDLQAAKDMIDAGATRIGTSSGAAILAGKTAEGY